MNLNLGGLGVMVARAIVDGVAGHGAVFTAAGRLLGPHSKDLGGDDIGGDNHYDGHVVI